MSAREFYIGWQDRMPDKTSGFLRKRLLAVAVLLAALAFLLVSTQRPFNDHSFELGSQQTITGTYYHSPFPLLVAEEGSLPAELSREILLVSYGKFGARGTMEAVMEKSGSLDRKKIKLSGTLIYGDGKTLLELTKKEAAFEGIEREELASPPMPSDIERVSFTGEILDPKCYFGVMKPGEGKIHKSCAIRCISGGIPPVFRVGSPGSFTYYLIVGSQGEEINERLLSQVGETIELTGRATKQKGWDILYCDSF